MAVTIQPANLEAADFVELIETHAALMLSQSPAESCHFLPIDGLKSDDISVWELRDGGQLIASGALKQIDLAHGEIKSMHTLAAHRGGGHGRAMLDHILTEARARNYSRLSLETGSMDGFAPARKLYESYGFVECGPFGDYVDDPLSYFMTLAL